MAGFEEQKALLHKIRVKLYPNYLNKHGKYIARTEGERSVTIEEICGNMRERGSFAGSPDDAVSNVYQFFEELEFLLCDCWTVHCRSFAIHPHIAGTWDSAAEAGDREKHPVRFSYRTLKPLREHAEKITVEVLGIAEETAYIAEILDTESDMVNKALTPGGVIVITGHKIKVSGSLPDVGVWLTGRKASGDMVNEKLVAKPIENSASKIIIKLPPVIEQGFYEIEIVTQYSGGNVELKGGRKLESPATFNVGFPASPAGDDKAEAAPPDDKAPSAG